MRAAQAALLLVVLWLAWAAAVGIDVNLLASMSIIGTWASSAGLAWELLQP